MEMSLLQQSALRSLQSLQATTSGPLNVLVGSSNQRCGGCGNSGLTFCNLRSGRNPEPISKLRRESFSHGRRGTYCRSSGGTRRDEAKIVARTQKRRSRHVKGVTPTKPELFDKLEAEEQSDADLERFQASMESEIETDTSDDSEEVSADGNDEGVDSGEKLSLETEAKNGKPKGDGSPGVEEIVENGENTYTIKYFPEGKKGGPQAAGQAAQSTIQDVSTTTQETVKDVSSTAQDTAEETGENLSKAGDRVQQNVEEVSEDVGDVVEEVSDVAQDTAEDVTNIAQGAATDVTNTVQDAAQDLTNIAQEPAGANVRLGTGDQVSSAGGSSPGVQEIVDTGDNTYTVKYFPEGKGGPQAAEDTAQNVVETAGEISDVAQNTAEDVTSTAQEAADETGKSLTEAGDAVRGNVEEVGTAVEEVSDIALDTAQDVTKTAQEAAQEVGQSLGEAGDTVLGSLEEVRSEGEKSIQEGRTALGEQLQEGQKEAEENISELGSQIEEAGDRARKAVGKASDEAGKSLQNVQESLAAFVEDSARTAESIGSEAIRLGEVLLTAAGEAAGFEGNREESGTSNGTTARKVVKEKPETEESKSKKRPQPSGTPGKTISGTEYKSSLPEESKEKDKNLYNGLKVTVAGASGRTGRLLVEELVRKGVPVRALVRDKNKSDARALGKLLNVEVVQADLYKYETIKKSLGDSNVVISAIGARSFPFDPIGTYQAEFEGVKNLVAAAKNKGDVRKFVFVTSLGVTFLQIIPLIFWKKQSELYLQRSGLDYTIVRPGGLTNETNVREVISMKPADTQFGGAISRRKVAEVCVAALITPEASEKIVEICEGDCTSMYGTVFSKPVLRLLSGVMQIVSGGGASRSFSDLFGSV